MTVEAFIAALLSMVSSLSSDQARAHVEGATAAATKYNLSVELLLGVAYVESHYDQRALSRLECATDDLKSCKRKTGVWASDKQPPEARGSWFCGPLQAGGYVSWVECQRMRADVAYGYEAGAKELAIWMNDKRCAALTPNDQLRCALAGHNAGNAGVAAYKTLAYVNWVLDARDRVVKFAEYEEKKERQPGS